MYVPDGSYIFTYREQIPRALLERNYDFEDFPPEEVAAAFEYSLKLVPESGRANIFAARIMMQIHREDWTGAQEELKRVRASGIPLEKELALVSKLLENHAN